jgi:hypothetical protein
MAFNSVHLKVVKTNTKKNITNLDLDTLFSISLHYQLKQTQYE